MNEQLVATRLRTSADYGNIERMAQDLAQRAAKQRPSTMLEFAVMDKHWRTIELRAQLLSYDVFAAWEDVALYADQLAVQLLWLSATYEGRVSAQGFQYTEVAARDVQELRVKNANYGESWKRRGGAGAFMMLARKWDRLDNLLAQSGGGATLDHLLAKNPGNVLDDVGDLRRYLLLVADEAPRWARGRTTTWRDIVSHDLPALGQEVLLLDVRSDEVVVASHRIDSGEVPPPETYWDVPRDQQYAIFERWTHWHPVPTKPALPPEPEDEAGEPTAGYVDQDRP